MASTSSADHSAPRKYSSPLHALVWSFRKSRDNWKRKYLDVKAQLKRARRRLDRLAQPSPSLSAPAAASATPVLSASAQSAPPSAQSRLLGLLLKELLDLRQQTQANREVLESCQQEHRSLLALAEQLQQWPDHAPLERSGSPTPVQARQPAVQSAAEQPLPKVPLQAPPEPKRGALRQHEN